jgi:hypothetical protein
MHTPFFITGLPQSRTTWLANLFSTGGVYCHHDLLGVVSSVEAMVKILRADAMGGRVGNSDSGLLACVPAMDAAFPYAKWVLVERNFEDAWADLRAFIESGPWQDDVKCSPELKDAMLAQWTTARARLIQSPRVLSVPFAALEHETVLEQVWAHCVPGVRFDLRRLRLLQTFSVRPHQAKCPLRVAPGLAAELASVT